MQQITIKKSSSLKQRAFSLIEITLVIGIMLTIASIITYSVGTLGEWKAGRTASEDLKTVYVAQKGYLADHPRAIPANFTSEKLVRYLPGTATAMPTAESLEGQELTLNFNSLPPVFKMGSTTYDPSESTSDGLWDVGGIH